MALVDDTPLRRVRVDTPLRCQVHPPRLDGLKVGLFATRSPHRPNNLGLSLVRLERVDGHTLTLTGVDLVDGTPILDIKPYVPFADGAALSSVTVAPWLDSLPTPELDVVWTDEATRQLAALEPELRLLRTAEQARHGPLGYWECSACVRVLFGGLSHLRHVSQARAAVSESYLFLRIPLQWGLFRCASSRPSRSP